MVPKLLVNPHLQQGLWSLEFRHFLVFLVHQLGPAIPACLSLLSHQVYPPHLSDLQLQQAPEVHQGPRAHPLQTLPSLQALQQVPGSLSLLVVPRRHSLHALPEGLVYQEHLWVHLLPLHQVHQLVQCHQAARGNQELQFVPEFLLLPSVLSHHLDPVHQVFQPSPEVPVILPLLSDRPHQCLPSLQADHQVQMGQGIQQGQWDLVLQWNQRFPWILFGRLVLEDQTLPFLH